MEWKWSTREKYSKTPREYKKNITENINNSVETQNGAIMQSLLSENELDTLWNYSITQGQMINQMKEESGNVKGRHRVARGTRRRTGRQTAPRPVS